MFSFNQILYNKYNVVLGVLLIGFPVYSWKSFIYYWFHLKKQYENTKYFYEHHNCVITYQPHKGFIGWTAVCDIKPVKDNVLESLYQPIIYFIRTAKKSLDISVMIINIKCINSEIIEAAKRGIKVRIINNFQESSRDYIQELIKHGVQFQVYISPHSAVDTIMHNKFIIKDYTSHDGYLCFGSMNYTTAVLTNYESLIFTSNYVVVEAFRNYFDECWSNISLDNKGLINKTILMDSHLDVLC